MKAPVNNNTKLLFILLFGSLGIFFVSNYVNSNPSGVEQVSVRGGETGEKTAPEEKWVAFRSPSDGIGFEYPQSATIGKDVVDGRPYYWMVYSPAAASNTHVSVQVELTELDNSVCLEAFKKASHKEDVGNVVVAVKRGTRPKTFSDDAVFVFSKLNKCFGVNEYQMGKESTAMSLSVAPQLIKTLKAN